MGKKENKRSNTDWHHQASVMINQVVVVLA
jgi:hypothetical protein